MEVVPNQNMTPFFQRIWKKKFSSNDKRCLRKEPEIDYYFCKFGIDVAQHFQNLKYNYQVPNMSTDPSIQNDDTVDGNVLLPITNMANSKNGLTRLIKKYTNAMEKPILMYHTYENPLQHYFNKYGIDPTIIPKRYDEDKDKIFFKLVNSKNPMTDYFWSTENTKRLVYKINH